jgi:general secretion pathway protein G
MKRINRGRRAFTLIELLVVLVILALLAGLVLPRLIGQIGRGSVATAKSQIAGFKTAISTYMLDHHGKPPSSLEDLISPPSNSGSGEWKGPYLADAKSVPLDPWGLPYIYETPGPAGNEYEIISLGSDGKEGGEGEAADLSSVSQ